MEEKGKKKINDFVELFTMLWGMRKTFFFKVWPITFILSCIWILPQPRTYECTTTVAPESSDDSPTGSLSSLASSFGIDLGGSSNDAIYPQIYPDLFGSTEFLSELSDIQIRTKDGEVATDYFDYLKNHQKENKLLYPLTWSMLKLKEMRGKKEASITGKDGKRFDPFNLTKETTGIFKAMQFNIKCSHSKTTDIVTISVKDQDPLVAALMCDSVKAHLQNYITDYRTRKARVDAEHYRNLLEQARVEYQKAIDNYSVFCDAHREITLPSYDTKRTQLENEMEQKLGLMNAVSARYEAAEAKVQEVTPVFTTIKNSTVPVKASAPKRMIFVMTMLILATMGTVVWKLRRELWEWF